jgi:HK97 family phage portal protein
MYTHQTAPIVGTGTNTLDGFHYDLDGLDYAPNIILWDRFIDPINFYDGLSPIRAAARTMDTENQAVDWNKNMFDNLAVPPGAIALMNASTESIKEAKKRWKEEYAGSKQSRMPLIFDSEKLSYISFGMNAIDMDFLNQKKVNRVEICAAFSVPGQVVGDPENQTFANYEQALKSFWMNTVLAKYVNKIAKKLNSEIVSAWNPRYLLRADVSEIQVLQEDENTKSERIRGEFMDNLLTQNEAREMLGYEAVPKGAMFNFELASALSDELIDYNSEGVEGDGPI